MSVIHIGKQHENEREIIVCTLSWISSLFATYNDDTESKKKNELLLQAIFDIRTPFLMDGEANKISLLMSRDSSETMLLNENNKRVISNYFEQKAKKTKNVSDLSLMEKENIECIRQRYEKVSKTLEFKKHFNYLATAEDFSTNNQMSRKAANFFLNASHVPLPNLVGKNDEPASVVHEYEGHKFLIPPSCRFVVGDVFELTSHFHGELFDVVVLDPPWHNKHVRRKRHARGLPYGYNTLSVEEIMGIPLRSVLAPNAFVFIWITNNTKMNAEVVNSLDVWDLELLATWFWLKVTRSGDPIVSFDTSLVRGKVPYEKLLVTRRKWKKEDGVQPSSFPDYLQNLIFMSVPSSIHSHKPPLKELLRQLLQVNDSFKCLELFSRTLTPGWTSLGKEVLRLQDLALVQEINS